MRLSALWQRPRLRPLSRALLRRPDDAPPGFAFLSLGSDRLRLGDSLLMLKVS